MITKYNEVVGFFAELLALAHCLSFIHLTKKTAFLTNGQFFVASEKLYSHCFIHRL